MRTLFWAVLSVVMLIGLLIVTAIHWPATLLQMRSVPMRIASKAWNRAVTTLRSMAWMPRATAVTHC